MSRIAEQSYNFQDTKLEASSECIEAKGAFRLNVSELNFGYRKLYDCCFGEQRRETMGLDMYLTKEVKKEAIYLEKVNSTINLFGDGYDRSDGREDPR